MSLRVAEQWYEVRELGDGVSLIEETHVADWLRCNIWHVRGRDRDLIIDTGVGLRPLTEAITRLAERPVTAIATHCHFDHAGGMYQFANRCGHRAEAEAYAEPTPTNTVADQGFIVAESFTALPFAGFDWKQFALRPAPLTSYLDEGDKIDLGDRHFEVLHLPGHSPGSIALFERATGLLFSGDVVYDGDLIDNFFHSDRDALAASHARLRTLPVATVHAGHSPSFSRDRLLQILDDYAAGGRRMSDVAAWVKSVTG